MLNDLFTNVYFQVAAIVAVVVVIWKVIDQRRDARQAVYQDIADAFDKFGQDQFAAAFKALARDGYEKFFSILVAVAQRLKAPNGVAEVLVTMIVKSIKDPEFRANPLVKERLEPVLAEMSLGFFLDDKTQSELVEVAHVLRDYGSKEFASLMSNLGANNIPAARVDFQMVVKLLRDTDRLDDEFMDRAEKLLPAIVKADPAHLTKLKAIVDSIKA